MPFSTKKAIQQAAKGMKKAKSAVKAAAKKAKRTIVRKLK